MSLQIVRGDKFSFVYIIGDFIMQKVKTWKPINQHLQNLFLSFHQRKLCTKRFWEKNYVFIIKVGPLFKN
jgi:hypothetical protein